MNQLAIQCNNLAVESLKKGDMAKAFDVISKASDIVTKSVTEHRHADNTGADDIFRFHWEDCSKARVAMNEKRSSMIRLYGNEPAAQSWEGSTPYLFLRGLRVSIHLTPDDDLSLTAHKDFDIERLCACSYAWVIWFNQAMICSVIGTMLGERGTRLLQLSFDLYRKCLIRVNAEPPSPHWNTLLLGILNNQACIYSDLSMFDAMGERLELLAKTILASKSLGASERRDFCINLQILRSQHLAPAA